MTSLAKRLVLTFTAIPALFSLIYFLPFRHHLAFSLLVMASAAIGTYEIKNIMFSPDEKPLMPFWTAAFLPMAEYLHIEFFPTFPISDSVLCLLMVIAFSFEIIKGGQDNFKHTLHRLSHSAILIFYPGFLMIYIVRLLALQNSTYLILMLFLLVFGNDTCAYVFGMLFGKSNRNIFAVSPNKSLAGFIGGTIGTIALSIVYVRLVPSMQSIFTGWQAALLGLIIAFSSDTGDLIESSFKRGAGVKDSGHIIMGRGGLMDSIDSLIASAPFFLIFTLLSIGVR